MKEKENENTRLKTEQVRAWREEVFPEHRMVIVGGERRGEYILFL